MKRIVFTALAALAVVALATLGRVYLTGNHDGSSGSVSIGGPFTLTDHAGREVTDETYRGQYMLIYFGYTFCPDVCPTSLSTMALALDALSEEELGKVQPIFISVDPERDTIEALADYVPNFHDKMIGMTGTPEQVKAVARAYKAYYAKTNEDDGDGNYLVDHSSITYLMGPDGKYAAHFGHGTPPEAMGKRLAEIL